MATETLAPDAVLVSTNYTTLNIGDVDEDPAANDGSWGTWDGNGNTVASVSFPTPTGAPTPGATQTFRVLIRKVASADAPSTAWSLQLYEGGSSVGVLATGTTTATDPGEVISGTWDAASLGTADGSAVECRLVQTSGGTGGTRRGIEVGAAAWDVVYSASQSYSITGAVTATVAVLASLLAFNAHPSLAGAVTQTTTPAASALVYNRHAALVGAVSATATPAAAMQYTSAGGAEIVGAISVGATVAGTMAYNRHYAVVGSTPGSVAVAGALAYNQHPALVGAVAVSITPASAAQYNRHASVAGAIAVGVVVSATMAYSAPTAAAVGWARALIPSPLLPLLLVPRAIVPKGT
jgi:hypothetical protein